MTRLLSYILLLGFFGLFQGSAQVWAAQDLPEGFVIETIIEDLERPTALAFAPDGRIFVALQGGVVHIIQDGELQSDPFITLQDINSAGDRGLIGIAIDPNFEENHFVYLGYTFENDPDATDDGGKKTARVLRVTEQDGVALPYDNGDIILGTVGGSPNFPSCSDHADGADCIASDSLSHTIGGLRFGPDKKLYISTGDGAGFSSVDSHAGRAQDLDHLSGKILRINTDGTAVSDNPFYTGNAGENRSKIWAYGFRNPYRFGFNDQANTLIAGNVGWFSYEELNFIEPGKNYGWPCFEGLEDSIGYSDPNQYSGCPLTDDPSDSDYSSQATDPMYYYSHESNGGYGAITAGTFMRHPSYPAPYRDQYIFADYVSERFLTMNISDTGTTSDTSVFARGAQSAVEITSDPRGMIYMITRNNPSDPFGDVQRIIYTNEPVAAMTVTGADGFAPLSTIFNAGDSQALNNGELTYAWDFGDGVIGEGVYVTHEYTEAGEYEAELTITAANGLSDTDTAIIIVSEPFNGDYDVDPRHVSTLVSEAPNVQGFPVHIASVVQNISGEALFDVRFEVRNRVTGTRLPDLDKYVPLQTITPGGERLFEVDLALPLGSYQVDLHLRSPDAVDTYELTTVASVDVVERSPIGSSDGEGESSGFPVEDVDPIEYAESIIPQAAETVTLYRFYSDVFKGHFYTISESEKEGLEDDTNWIYEGEAYSFTSPAEDQGVPVYRFYSDVFKGHFYTISETEKTMTQNDENWIYEGVAYDVLSAASNDSRPIYRFWSPAFKHHFFTQSLQERDQIRLTDENWIYEGIAWHVQ
jgi:glucose/arabinose dehydrogenase